MKKIALSELLVELRRELEAAQQQAVDQRLKFKVEDIELELRVGVTKKGGTEFGVKFWVYNAGMKGEIANDAIQTIRLKLKPVPSEEGKDLEVSRRGRR